MALPCESNWSKSKEELIHELEINHERVNAAGQTARNLHLEVERLKLEQGRQAELYVRALTERRELQGKLDEANRVVKTVAAVIAQQQETRDALVDEKDARDRLYSELTRLEDLVEGNTPRKYLRDHVKEQRENR
jgi:ATP-dependent Lon protease